MTSMGSTYAACTVEFDSRAAVVTVDFTGPVSARNLIETREAIADSVDARPVVGMVIDGRGAAAAYGEGELAEAVEDALTDAAFERCAIVTRNADASLLALIQSAALAHGVRVRGFVDRDEATRWAAVG